MSALKNSIFKILPWIVTALALYYAFLGVDWTTLFAHLGEAQPFWIALAVLFTCSSYLLRSWRWQSLFPEHTFHFIDSARVLFLGFFMNNILPARAGEFVRAHMGAKLAGETRTLVLATIANERLIDGLTISLMFAVFALGVGDSTMSTELLYVAYAFAAVGIMVIVMLAMRERLFLLFEKLHSYFDSPASGYASNRVRVFINGLSPLSSAKRLPLLIIFSMAVWGAELAVYKTIGQAFSADLNLPQCVLFLVAVNFASLIPAAPGGVGIIELIASTALVSVGVQKELALTMVIAQHAIQYLVVGLPGAVIMFNWKKTIDEVRMAKDEQGTDSNQ